jgi:hypothetical protein
MFNIGICVSWPFSSMKIRDVHDLPTQPINPPNVLVTFIYSPSLYPGSFP